MEMRKNMERIVRRRRRTKVTDNAANEEQGQRRKEDFEDPRARHRPPEPENGEKG